MSPYRRAFIPGGTWFFTVNLLQRHHNDWLVREIDLLSETGQRVRKHYPFRIDAWVVLPKHGHCVWPIGRIPHSITMLRAAFIRWIGAAMPMSRLVAVVCDEEAVKGGDVMAGTGRNGKNT